MEHTPPPFFKRGPAPLVRLFFFASLSLALLVLDARFRYAESLRGVLALAAYPLQRAATAPVDLLGTVGDYFSTQAQLFEEVQGGACDAAILDAPILGAERAQLPFRYGPLAGLINTGENYGIVLPKGSELEGAVDEALAGFIADGTLERLSAKWLSTDLSTLPVLQ